MPNGENQKPEEKPRPKHLGVRTMVGDVKELVRGGKISLAALVSSKRGRESESAEENLFEKIRPYAILGASVAVIIIIALGAFWFTRKATMPDESVLRPAPSLISAGRETIVKIESLDRNAFLSKWKKLFGAQLLPREFLHASFFAQGHEDVLEMSAKEIFELAGVRLPPLLDGAFAARSTFGVIDTSRGNEAIFIIEINNYSSAFAGLLEWESLLPSSLVPLLNPELVYDRGENIFRDVIVANNDARFLQNRLGEFVLGHSIFNRRFLIITQSSQALEVVIRQMSALPAR